jgi:ribonuclease-3
LTDDATRLSKHLDLAFHDLTLLDCALTHRSASGRNNERLEYLGDGALNFIIASELYFRKPDADEGTLSRLRAFLVRGATLSEIARELDLGDFLLLGTGELRSGGFERDSILADALEAIIGAVYLDAGFEPCRAFVLRLYEARLASLPSPEELLDPKTRLQEFLQARGMSRPRYETLEVTGKPHAQQFLVACHIEQPAVTCEARATSRRKAEQAAALEVLNQLREHKDIAKSRKRSS